MALFVNQNEERTKLQERLAAELQDRAKRTHELENKSQNGVDDQEYLKGTKTAGPLLAFWIFVAVLAFVILGVFVATNQR